MQPKPDKFLGLQIKKRLPTNWQSLFNFGLLLGDGLSLQ